MAKIKIMGVGYDQSNYTVQVQVTDIQTLEGEDAEASLGEAVVRFPTGTEMEDVKTKILDAAKLILKAYQNARDKRKDIEELEFPDIT